MSLRNPESCASCGCVFDAPDPRLGAVRFCSSPCRERGAREHGPLPGGRILSVWDPPEADGGYGADAPPVTSAVRSIVGTVPYDTLSDHPHSADDGSALRVVFLAGCFTETLDRLAAGDGPVIKLLDRHSFNRVLASTADGTLSVWQTAAGLHWRARAVPPAVVKWCSLGCTPGEAVFHRLGTGEAIRVVTRSRLVEVTITDRPAMRAPAWIE